MSDFIGQFAQANIEEVSSSSASSGAKGGIVTPSGSYAIYSQVGMQFSGGFDAIIKFQASDDNSIWNDVTVIDVATSERVWTVDYNGIFVYPIELAYFRAIIDIYNSGTVNCHTFLSKVKYTRNVTTPDQKAAFNLKNLELQGTSLSNYVTDNDGNLIYLQDGNLVRI